jgi:hypothetical protein
MSEKKKKKSSFFLLLYNRKWYKEKTAPTYEKGILIEFYIGQTKNN